MITAAKIVQIERNAKGKLVFLCISEMQPIFDQRSKIVQIEQKTKFPLRIFSLASVYFCGADDVVDGAHEG